MYFLYKNLKYGSYFSGIIKHFKQDKTIKSLIFYFLPRSPKIKNDWNDENNFTFITNKIIRKNWLNFAILFFIFSNLCKIFRNLKIVSSLRALIIYLFYIPRVQKILIFFLNKSHCAMRRIHPSSSPLNAHQVHPLSTLLPPLERRATRFLSNLESSSLLRTNECAKSGHCFWLSTCTKSRKIS